MVGWHHWLNGHEFAQSEVKWSEVKSLSRVRLLVTPWTIVLQATLSMAFPRQEYCSGLLFPFPGDLPNPGIEPRSPALQAGSLPSKPQGKPLRYVLSMKE